MLAPQENEMATPPRLNAILYVEDDSELRTLVNMLLANLEKFTVRACASGAEALQEAKNFVPDLLLLDVAMPGMDGTETLLALRERAGTATTPVIFLTSNALDHEVAYYSTLGAIGVIAKPFDPGQLGEEIRRMWHTHEWPGMHQG
jgi:two-component system, OmpR family, response regulator